MLYFEITKGKYSNKWIMDLKHYTMNGEMLYQVGKDIIIREWWHYYVFWKNWSRNSNMLATVLKQIH